MALEVGEAASLHRVVGQMVPEHGHVLHDHRGQGGRIVGEGIQVAVPSMRVDLGPVVPVLQVVADVTGRGMCSVGHVSFFPMIRWMDVPLKMASF